MILLGSIDRLELLALCDWWLSPERRLLMQVRSGACLLVHVICCQMAREAEAATLKQENLVMHTKLSKCIQGFY